MQRLFNALLLLLKIVLLCFVVLFTLFNTLLIDIPDLNLLKETNPTVTSYMLLDKNWDDEYRSVFVPLSHISPNIVKAILVSEDDMFFVHEGFNWQEVFRAVRIDIKKKKFKRGASTITQQLARNLFLSRNKSLFRKLREGILTLQLEQTLSKKRILELYLNCAQFGPAIYGVEGASKYHFASKASRLSASQAALLAAVLPNPARYGKKPYPGITYRRQQIVLFKLEYDLHLPNDLFLGPK